jgi:hypothetical protein
MVLFFVYFVFPPLCDREGTTRHHTTSSHAVISPIIRITPLLFGDCIFQPKSATLLTDTYLPAIMRLQAYQPSLTSISFPFQSINTRRMPSRMYAQSRTGQSSMDHRGHDLSVLFRVAVVFAAGKEVKIVESC